MFSGTWESSPPDKKVKNSMRKRTILFIASILTGLVPCRAAEPEENGGQQSLDTPEPISKSVFYMGADVFPTDSEELKIWSVLTDYYQTEILKVIAAAPSEVESKWSTLLAKMDELGLEKLNDFWTDFFKNKSALQEKYSADL